MSGKTYRSIFISDVHLGTRDCKAEALNNFLKLVLELNSFGKTKQIADEIQPILDFYNR